MIKHYSETNITEGATTILERGLYSAVGTMQYWCRSPDIIKFIAIYFKGSVPVGSLIVLKNDQLDYTGSYNCGTYVLAEHRRQKVGSMLVKHCKNMGIELKPWTGYFSAEKFYSSNGYINS
jgi:GNAT superfamily N-acetyltransferase